MPQNFQAATFCHQLIQQVANGIFRWQIYYLLLLISNPVTFILLSAPPDVSLYQYDETSGYYYDPVTTLYYDANTTYYYNGNTGQFLYWDAEQSTYLPAPTGDEDPNKTDQKEDKKEGKDKKEKVKVAKKIAKVTEEYLLQ